MLFRGRTTVIYKNSFPVLSRSFSLSLSRSHSHSLRDRVRSVFIVSDVRRRIEEGEIESKKEIRTVGRYRHLYLTLSTHAYESSPERVNSTREAFSSFFFFFFPPLCDSSDIPIYLICARKFRGEWGMETSSYSVTKKKRDAWNTMEIHNFCLALSNKIVP